MKRGVACSPPSFHSKDKAERIEELIENLIRCIANTQVKVQTNEAALAKFRLELNQLATSCEVLETKQQELCKKVTQLEHKVASFNYVSM